MKIILNAYSMPHKSGRENYKSTASHPKKFIQSAIKHPGALRAQLNVKGEGKIPYSVLQKASKAKGKLGQRARFAKTLRKLSKRK